MVCEGGHEEPEGDGEEDREGDDTSDGYACEYSQKPLPGFL